MKRTMLTVYPHSNARPTLMNNTNNIIPSQRFSPMEVVENVKATFLAV
jgi:hypothetical protein